MVSDWHTKYVTWLSRAIAEHGGEVRMLTRDHDLEFGGETGHVEPGTMERWVTQTLEGKAAHIQLRGRIRDPAGLPQMARLWRQLRAFRPDVLHFQDAVAQDVRLLIVANVPPREYALTIHDVVRHPGDQVPRARTARVRKQLIANAGLIFVHSPVLREKLLDRERPSAPVVVVPHGMEPVVAPPLPHDPTLLFFGRIAHYKGVDTLLDAVERLWMDRPDVRLVIAGGGELPTHAALNDPRVAVRNDHIPEEELEGLFAAARGVVLPYLEASQSGVGSRAKAYGRPLVVTDVGGLPDLVADGSGVVVAAGDAASLASGIRRVLAPGEGERMSAAALEGVAEASWERVGGMTLNAYQRHLLAH